MRRKYAEGGVITGGRLDSDSVPVLLHTGCSYYMPAQVIEKLGARDLLRLINDGATPTE